MSALFRQQGSRGMADTLAVAAAVLASIAMIRLATGSTAVTLAYAGGLVVLALTAFAAARRRATPTDTAESTFPDWSVTVAAIEQPGLAIAITDRANRLVCANAAYELWFGSSHAPPRVPVDGASARHPPRPTPLSRSSIRMGASRALASSP